MSASTPEQAPSRPVPGAPTLIVMAKAPEPGRSKTRLCPPCTPAQAAELAQAALRDTLAAVAATRALRRLVALDGEVGDWLPPGFEVMPQRGDGLEQRLHAAFHDSGGPAFLVAMDTPQLTPELLDFALDQLEAPGTGAVLGPTRDGGYWGIGLRRSDPAVFQGVPMSSPATHATQLERLRALGHGTSALQVLVDVDTITQAREVAHAAPSTRFAAALRASGHAEQTMAEAAPSERGSSTGSRSLGGSEGDHVASVDRSA